MNLNEIKVFLEENFNKPTLEGKNRHIVFWYDSESDFIDDIDSLDLQNVKILKLTKNNAFFTKYYIEKEDLTSNILVYSNMSKPAPNEDYLYDILCYSQEFSTDRITVIMRELGVTNESLKGIFKKYNTLFKNKERIATFKNLNIENYTEEKVNLAILASLTKVKTLELEEIVKALIIEYLNDRSKYYEDICKFGDIIALLELVQKYYGYKFDEFSIEKLMATLLITNFKDSIKFTLPKQYDTYVSVREGNCMVFLNHLMNHIKDNEYYDKMAQSVAEKLNIYDMLKNNDIDTIGECETFEEVDKIILNNIVELLNNDGEEFERYLRLISNRRTLHFYSKYKDLYESVRYAIKFLNKKKDVDYIRGASSYDMFQRYISDYYLFDKYYRKFYLHYDKCLDKELIESIRDNIENVYSNWYLDELAIKWNSAIKNNSSNSWVIDGLNQQYKFFNDFIRFKYEKERVVVIISDALRYECASQLNDNLNSQSKNKWKGVAELFAMQGVLPSYTKLGMASLLPNKIIEINDKCDVLVDGINSSGTENRNKILETYSEKAVAVTYNDLKGYKRADYKENFAGKEIIYVYHNTIDAIGDHSITENQVFDAAEKAIDEIMTIANSFIGNLSVSNFIITADHGFLYKRDKLTVSDKINGVKFDDGEDGRRFVLTDSNEEIDGTNVISMDYILGENSGKNVITPKGTMRFKVQGAGSNYVHGGSMLQEIVVPVIKFKLDRSKSTSNLVKKTVVKLTSISRKITNPIVYLEFFQEEKVQERVLPVRIKCYLEDEEGNRISDERTIIADSKSDAPTERTQREKFILKSIKYDKNKQYFLVIQDEEDTNGLYERIPYIIDIVFVDEFGF
ncbi:MAG: BREX-1 system phosphatase PglZ type A [Clostridium celatum]|nr:BREX-1 system phosphatase PglZ type A [Clostridium celatum]